MKGSFAPVLGRFGCANRVSDEQFYLRRIPGKGLGGVVRDAEEMLGLLNALRPYRGGAAPSAAGVGRMASSDPHHIRHYVVQPQRMLASRSGAASCT
jgi:hypothetical protein